MRSVRTRAKLWLLTLLVKVASGEILFSVISSGPLLFSASLREERLSALLSDFRVPHSAFKIVPHSAFQLPRLPGPSAAHIRNVADKLHTLHKQSCLARSPRKDSSGFFSRLMLALACLAYLA